MSEYMGASKHMGGVEMPPNIWGCQLNSPKCRTYMLLKKLGCLKHMGVLGHQGSVQMHGGIQTYGGCPDASNIWGCQVDAPKCKSYMLLKKISSV